MQYTLLAIVALLVGIVVIGAYEHNRYRNRRRLAARSSTEFEVIYQQHFGHLDFGITREVWDGFAAILGQDPAKMLPNETIREVLPRHLPELEMGVIENYLRQSFVEPVRVELDTQIRDIVEEIVRQRESAKKSSGLAVKRGTNTENR